MNTYTGAILTNTPIWLPLYKIWTNLKYTISRKHIQLYFWKTQQKQIDRFRINIVLFRIRLKSARSVLCMNACLIQFHVIQISKSSEYYNINMYTYNNIKKYQRYFLQFLLFERHLSLLFKTRHKRIQSTNNLPSSITFYSEQGQSVCSFTYGGHYTKIF